MIERQAEEAKLAKEARGREEAKGATERAERTRQQRMNELAHRECRELWRPLLAQGGLGVRGGDGGGGDGGGGGGGGGGVGGGAGGGGDGGGGEEGSRLSALELRLARRVTHRAELQLVLMTPPQVKVLP